MGSPYLDSGEAIILTTNRVSADAVPYDVMLTTERIFLMDSRYTRFEPQIIPLSAILSVQGGKTPAHDPVITLQFRTGGEASARQPLNLVFSQDPNENRKQERDDWMRSLIQLSIAWHEKEAVAKVPAVPEVTGEIGLRPTVRHSVAPEKVRPLSHVSDRLAAMVPVTVIPDEDEGSGEIPVPAAAITPVEVETHTTEPVQEEPATAITPVRGTPPHQPAPPARVIIPQIIEELMPARTTDVPPVEQVPAPVADIDHETLHHSIQTAVRSLMVTDGPAPEPPLIPETATMPEVPAGETEPDQITVVPHLATAEPPEVPEIARALHTGATELVTPDPAVATGPVTEPAPERLRKGIHETPEPQVTLPIPENPVEEAVGYPAPEAISRGEPAAAEAPPVWRPIPPAGAAPPPRTTLAYTAVLLLLIALVAAGAVLLLAQGSGLTDNPATPTPGAMQVTTLPPGTVQPTTVPPVTPGITTTSPSLSIPVSVPQVGVWVRVNSTANYAGSLGNAGFLRTVSGSGDTFYKVLWSDRIVQVSVRKQDNSGALLAVGIYRNGTLISTGSVTSPMGTVDLLIDPITGRPPGLTAGDMPTSFHATVQPTAQSPVTPRITTTSPSPSIPVSVPQVGVWVRVNSTANYAGSLGNAGFLKTVSGSGDNFYKVLWSDRIVQVSVRKQDNSGALLAVGIYRNGTLISTGSVTAPMGTVDLLIDPVTGRAPGLNADDMP